MSAPADAPHDLLESTSLLWRQGGEKVTSKDAERSDASEREDSSPFHNKKAPLLLDTVLPHSRAEMDAG